MRLRIVVRVAGTLVRLFSPAFLAAAVVALWYAETRDAIGFVTISALTALLGTAMRRAAGPEADEIGRLRRVEGLAIVAGTWMVIAHLAAIPYVWSGLGFIDALFESMSGLTTTGATVFRDFGAFGRGVFFWRALTHWLGGLGVIALFIAVLPRLAIGGRELFFAEAAGTDRREADTAASAHRDRSVEDLLAPDCGPDPRAVARGDVPVRRRLQRVRDDGGRRVLAASAVHRRVPERGRRLDRDGLHVRGGSQLRAAVPGGARKPECPGPGRGVPGLHRDRRRGRAAARRGAVPAGDDGARRDSARRRSRCCPS